MMGYKTKMKAMIAEKGAVMFPQSHRNQVVRLPAGAGSCG